MSGELISFGKYKGQSVEVMSQDRAYCEWLAAQPWFKEKFSAIYQIVVNNFNQEPADTPEHNALQVRFLDRAFQMRVAHALVDRMDLENARAKQTRLRAEHRELVGVSDVDAVAWATLRQRIGRDACFDVEGWLNNTECCGVAFERHGWDVWLGFSIGGFRTSWGLELKPAVADEFPTVMRQIKQLFNPGRGREVPWHAVLFLERYTGVGATEEQFIQFFENEKIGVLFLNEV